MVRVSVEGTGPSSTVSCQFGVRGFEVLVSVEGAGPSSTVNSVFGFLGFDFRRESINV